MTIPYSVKYSMRLDELVYDYYGSLEMFERTLELNPSLTNVLILKTGTTVQLEKKQITQTKTSEENLKSLW